MGHTNIHVEPIKLQQPDLLCFCEDIYLQKVQEPKFGFLNRTIRLTKQAFLFHYDSLWRSSFFWDVTQRRLIVTDVSEQPISPIFNGQVVFCCSYTSQISSTCKPPPPPTPTKCAPFPNITPSRLVKR
jgi:hypothetical protein